MQAFEVTVPSCCQSTALSDSKCSVSARGHIDKADTRSAGQICSWCLISRGPAGGGGLIQLGVDFLLFSLHHLRSMYEKGWNPKFHESSFKNEDLVADQSSGLKAEKRSIIVDFDFYKEKFGTQAFPKAAKN